MTEKRPIDLVIGSLNDAFTRDPMIEVEQSRVIDNATSVGMIGIINGITRSLGVGTVAAEWSEPDKDGNRKLIGFRESAELIRATFINDDLSALSNLQLQLGRGETRKTIVPPEGLGEDQDVNLCPTCGACGTGG